MVTLGCWFHCRYNYAKLRIQERLAREGIKNKILYESTHLDPARKQTNGGSSGNWAVLSIENPDTIHFIVNKAEMNYRERFMYHKTAFNQVNKVCVSCSLFYTCQYLQTYSGSVSTVHIAWWTHFKSSLCLTCLEKCLLIVSSEYTCLKKSQLDVKTCLKNKSQLHYCTLLKMKGYFLISIRDFISDLKLMDRFPIVTFKMYPLLDCILPF